MESQGPKLTTRGPRAPNPQPGCPGPLIDIYGALGPPTDNQEALGPLTDDQGYRARGPLIQIFNNLNANPVRNLRVLF